MFEASIYKSFVIRLFFLKPIIISFPRSGKSYLQANLVFAFKKDFDFSHLNRPGQIKKLDYYDHLIALVRNPIDSISSIVAMELEFDKNLEINDSINDRIKEYINFYSFALKNADTFIYFNDIVDNINKVVEYVSLVTNYPILNNEPKNNIIKNLKGHKFLKTSKETGKYKEIVFAVKNKDLDECLKLYKNALEMCIKINAD